MPAEFGIKKTVQLTMDATEAKIRTLLAEQGFGILTEIDVAATLKKKIDVDFKPFKILGACNPPFAHKALTLDEDVSLLMPCNVTLSGTSDTTTLVTAFDPEAAARLIGNQELLELSHDAALRIRRAMEKL